MLIILSCNDGPKKPDISHIKVQLNVKRFEKEFFAMDTLKLENSLLSLHQSYPLFLGDFIHNILGIQSNDSTMLNGGIKKFIQEPTLKIVLYVIILGLKLRSNVIHASMRTVIQTIVTVVLILIMNRKK